MTSVTELPQQRYEAIRPHHIRALIDIEQEAYPDPWTYGMFHQETESHVSQFFVMYDGGVIQGYGGFWLVLDEAHITKVTIAKHLRGQGLGRQFMEFLIAWSRLLGATTVRLEVRESNAAARTLYENLGFEVLGIRERYYATSGENAIVMMKTLEEPGF